MFYLFSLLFTILSKRIYEIIYEITSKINFNLSKDLLLLLFSFIDAWLTRILYQNGLALWTAILFYESCLSIIISLIYTYGMSTGIASIFGSSIFLLGIFLTFIHEMFIHKDSLSPILSHWIIFLWLTYDINISQKKFRAISLFSGMLPSASFYIILNFVIFRLFIFYLLYRRKELSMFRSGRVYSLIPRPRRAF